MDVRDLLDELYGRIPHLVRGAVDGLGPDQLAAAPGPGRNTIGWLVWHLVRVQDHHVSELLDEQQLWVAGDWGPRFGRTSDPEDTGYGHGADDVAAVRPESADALLEYQDAVAARTRDLLAPLTPGDLD